MRFFSAHFCAQHKFFCCIAAMLLWVMPAHAVMIEKPLPEPAQEQVAQAAFHALKCVVCEGQSVADSDAPFAAQMRAEIRRMAADGKSTQEILDFFAAHYGTRILLNPPLQLDTLALFLTPVFALLLGGICIYRFTKKRALYD